MSENYGRSPVEIREDAALQLLLGYEVANKVFGGGFLREPPEEVVEEILAGKPFAVRVAKETLMRQVEDHITRLSRRYDNSWVSGAHQRVLNALYD